jgi:hypothetical protein
MAAMGIHIMGMVAAIMVEGTMVADTMEVVVTIDLQTDPIDQDLNILSQDRTDQQQCRLDQLGRDLLPDHQEV